MLQAGHGATAVKYSELYSAVAATHVWPEQWQGGEVASIYKKRGNIKLCDAFRGILLADHAGKALTGMTKRSLDSDYAAKMPKDQFGAVARRGTDFASHILISFLAITAMMEWSVFVLFMDRAKALDRVIRQIVLGWSVDLVTFEQKAAYLRNLGVPARAATWMVAWIEERGPLLAQWNAPSTASSIARTLHEGAWFRVKGGKRKIESRTGGRQGCCLGALVFNCNYSVALDMMHWKLKKRRYHHE